MTPTFEAEAVRTAADLARDANLLQTGADAAGFRPGQGRGRRGVGESGRRRPAKCRRQSSRPIGMMVLDRLARGQVGPADVFEPEYDRSYWAWESKYMQLRNAPVSAVILNEWTFPSDVVEAVRGHCLATSLKDPTRGTCLLNIAGWVSQELGQGLPGERDLWELTPKKLEMAGLREEQVKEQLENVAWLFERMQPALRLVSTHAAGL